MKKINSIMMLVAAAAIAFSACQKQETFEPETTTTEVVLTFSSEKPAFADETKTEWTGDAIQWSEGDKIRVAYTAAGVWQNADGNATAAEENGSKTARIYVSNSVEAGETASFSVPGTFNIPTGVDLEFYGVYPSTTASGTEMRYAPSVTVTIPAEQKPLANSFDSKADLMAAKSVSTYTLSEENPLPEAIPLMWTRLVAHGYFTLKNLAVVGEENIESIVLTANDEADMVGQHYLYLDTYNVEKPSGNSAPNKLTIDATNLTIADGSVSFWACFLPCTWTSVTVQVETDKATYTREIDLSAKQKTFAKNARNTLAINMETATRDEKVVSVDELPFVRDFSGMTGNDELTELDGFSELSKVYNNTSSIRLATSSAAGLLETNPLNLSQDFHVIVTARGWADDEMQMTVSAGEQEHNVALTTFGTDGEFVEYVMNFTPVGESATVSFTAAADKRYYIQKIQVLAGHADLPSTLTVTAPEQMSAEGGQGYFTYTLTNPKDGIPLTVSEDAEWITNVVAAEGTVTYTVEANDTEDPREADITLTYGDLAETVTVSQKGQAAAGVAYYEKVTSAPADWSGTYLVVFESINACWDGSLLCGTSTGQLGHTAGSKVIAINDGKIEYNDSYFVIEKSGTAYTITSAYGDVIGMSTNDNGLRSGDYTNNITINNDNTVNIVSSDGYTQVAYNASAKYIRFYKTTTVSSNNYPKPCLYKLIDGNSDGEGSGTPDPEEPENPSSKTFTMTIDASSFNSTSYAANNNEKTSIATASDGSSMEVKWTSYQVMKQSSNIQWQKSKGYIYNSTDLGTITDITITSTAGTYTKYVGASSQPTAEGTGGFFKIMVGSATGTASKIEITFTTN